MREMPSEREAVRTALTEPINLQTVAVISIAVPRSSVQTAAANVWAETLSDVAKRRISEWQGEKMLLTNE